MELCPEPKQCAEAMPRTLLSCCSPCLFSRLLPSRWVLGVCCTSWHMHPPGLLFRPLALGSPLYLLLACFPQAAPLLPPYSFLLGLGGNRDFYPSQNRRILALGAMVGFLSWLLPAVVGADKGGL